MTDELTLNEQARAKCRALNMYHGEHFLGMESSVKNADTVLSNCVRDMAYLVAAVSLNSQDSKKNSCQFATRVLNEIDKQLNQLVFEGIDIGYADQD